jgi:hypothetical protein
VASGGDAPPLARRRAELIRLYDSTTARIRRRGTLSPLGAIRWLAHLAESRAEDQPECAFVECTALQAEGHAREITAALRFPCLPLTTDDLARHRLPRHLRLVLTTGFHVGEVRAAARRSGVPVISVPIEVDPEVVSAFAPDGTDVVVVEMHPDMANHVASDVAIATGQRRLRSVVAPDPSTTLKSLVGPPRRPNRDRLALLSPRVWGTIAPRWRKHPRVRQLAFRICPSAWSSISDRLGLPLGLLG